MFPSFKQFLAHKPLLTAIGAARRCRSRPYCVRPTPKASDVAYHTLHASNTKTYKKLRTSHLQCFLLSRVASFLLTWEVGVSTITSWFCFPPIQTYSYRTTCCPQAPNDNTINVRVLARGMLVSPLSTLSLSIAFSASQADCVADRSFGGCSLRYNGVPRTESEICEPHIGVGFELRAHDCVKHQYPAEANQESHPELVDEGVEPVVRVRPNLLVHVHNPQRKQRRHQGGFSLR